jgi:uncharacterized protein YqgV (UPF0045/DUF77 family)
MRFDVAVLPTGSGASLNEPLDELVNAVRRAGLFCQVSGVDAVIEGDWESVMPVVRSAEKRILGRHPRVYLSVAVRRDPPVARATPHIVS